MFHILLAIIAQVGEPSGESEGRAGQLLKLTPPVACSKINGYEDFVVLDPPELTKDEKLLIYCKPIGHNYVQTGEVYRAHLIEDLAVRRKGKKKPLWTRKKAIDFKVESEYPPLKLYLGTTVGLKGLEPGEYEAELIVSDELGQGEPVTQVLGFKVVGSRPGEVAKPEESRQVR